MEAFLLNLAFKAVRLIFGWLWKIMRPMFGNLMSALWPLVRFLLIVVGIIAGIILMRQFISRNPELISRLRAKVTARQIE